ncbi:MAG: hypothetical protein WAQ08_01010 [Aquabacterium sp.]|jgi:hypothetical protein|uniref:hypothetical protein n=1 Tax=Aquabacterium sp. TaxID=1872578 RepID=UPI003BB1EC0E
MDSVEKAPTRCTSLQFFGEYLHAFEDTFGHRNKTNEPIDINLGLGHLAYGHEADKTYNENNVILLNPVYFMGNGDWTVRESRTLRMEEEVFLKMSQFSKYPKASWDQIKDIMEAFNAIQENGEQDDKDDNGVKFKQKLELPNKALRDLNITRPNGSSIDFLTSTINGGEGPSASGTSQEAASNRNRFLCTVDGKRLNQENYPGTILPKTPYHASNN